MTAQSEINTKNNKQRLLSVDALRGFDMFWIMGAEGIFSALFVATGWVGFEIFAEQMLHTQWHGITAYDVIFPLFIFLSGVSIGIAAKPIATYTIDVRREKYRHAFKRLTLLLLLGVVYNHGWGTGIPANMDEIRYASVLGRIGIAWFVAMMLVWHVSIKLQWWISIGILVVYWIILEWVSLDGFGGGNYTAAYSLNVWFDQHLLPGITYKNAPADPEGILSNIPSIVNAMAGVFAGRFMKLHQECPRKILQTLMAAAVTCLMVGYLWGIYMPINKSLWTSSFVLITCSISLALLALFYGVIDVLQWQSWARFFAIIGVNSVVIYLSASLVNWQYTASSLFGGLITSLPEQWHGVFVIAAMLLVQWLFLYWLYARKIFIKV